MIARFPLLALFVLAPAILSAQEAPVQPVPDVTFDSPSLPAPLPVEPGPGTVDSISPEVPPTANTETDTKQGGVVPAEAMAAGAGSDGQAEPLPQYESLTDQGDLVGRAQAAFASAAEFLRNGGPSIWAIAALSVVTVTLLLWKTWRLALIGAWSRGKAGQALERFEAGEHDVALSIVQGRRGIRSRVVSKAIIAIETMPESRAREETARVAKRELADAGTGLRALELIATIAPLLGLLGTVLGMIAAFQALQQAGSRADPSLLAGGIWEALLTTAAGMAVAIPASAGLTWFEAVIDRIRRDVEDGATRLFVSADPKPLKLAAE